MWMWMNSGVDACPCAWCSRRGAYSVLCTLRQLDLCAHGRCSHRVHLSLPRHPVLLCTVVWWQRAPDLAQIVWRRITVPDADGQRELVCVRGRQYHLADDVAWLTSDTMQRPLSQKPFTISPAAVGEPGAQRRTVLSDPDPPLLFLDKDGHEGWAGA